MPRSAPNPGAPTLPNPAGPTPSNRMALPGARLVRVRIIGPGPVRVDGETYQPGEVHEISTADAAALGSAHVQPAE